MKQLLVEDPQEPTVDKHFLSLMNNRSIEKLPAGARGLPSWAQPGAKNARGHCAVSSSHYMGLACVEGTFLEITLDSGGSKTMVDKHTAIKMGLDIEWADQTKKYYGTFSGVSGTSMQYLGVTKKPVLV